MSETLRRVALIGGLGIGGSVAAADAANLYFRSNRFSERFPGASRPSLTFPTDLKIAQNVPFMSMEFSAYRRRSIYEQPFFESQMKIALPIPENLVERTAVTYETPDLGTALGATVESLSRGVPSSVSSAVGQLATAAGGIGAQAVQNLAGRNVTAAASTLFGITTNPFQVVLFKSPQFRSHTFSWKLVPRSLEESEILREIIETFKYHSLPGLSALGGVFFSYPEILNINFRPSDRFLYKFKPCVVESISANFAPNSPSFYRSSNAPTAVQFDIRVQEIEIWTKADYLREGGRFGNPVTPEALRSLGL